MDCCRVTGQGSHEPRHSFSSSLNPTPYILHPTLQTPDPTPRTLAKTPSFFQCQGKEITAQPLIIPDTFGEDCNTDLLARRVRIKSISVLALPILPPHTNAKPALRATTPLQPAKPSHGPSASGFPSAANEGASILESGTGSEQEGEDGDVETSTPRGAGDGDSVGDMPRPIAVVVLTNRLGL